MEGLLVLLGAVLMLGSTQANNYDELYTSRKGIVDKAIELANNVSGHRKHIDFDSILNSDNKGMVHVLLKPTSCDKKEYVHRRECKTNDLKPWMSCVACSNTMDCVRLRERKPCIPAGNGYNCSHYRYSVRVTKQGLPGERICCSNKVPQKETQSN